MAYMLAFTLAVTITNESYQSNHTLSFFDIISMNFFEENINGRLDKFKVQSFSGKVSYSNFGAKKIESKQIEIDTVLRAGDIVETGKESSVILSFGETFNSYLKISENSKVILEFEENHNEQDQMNNKNVSLVLKVGSLLFDIVDKYDLINFKVKSNRTTLNVDKSKFLATTDNKEYLTVAVARGELSILDSLTNKSQKLFDGIGMTFYKDGQERKISIKKLGINWNLFKNNKGRLLNSSSLKKANKRFSSKGMNLLRSKLMELEKLGSIEDKIEALSEIFKLNLKKLDKSRTKTNRIILILEKNIKIVQSRVNENETEIDKLKLSKYKSKLNIARIQLTSIDKRIDAGVSLKKRLSVESNGDNVAEKLTVLMLDYQRIYSEILSQQAATISKKK
jgi:hypothetical protein